MALTSKIARWRRSASSANWLLAPTNENPSPTPRIASASTAGAGRSPARIWIASGAPATTHTAVSAPHAKAPSKVRAVAARRRTRSVAAARASTGNSAPTSSTGTPMATSITRKAVAK